MLAPVAHRQYVFTLPKLLRPIFSRRRAWLGELCRIAARLLTDAYTAAAPGARPGLILFVQTFGDLANFNPHLHVLAPDGVFGADGTFTARTAGARSAHLPEIFGARCFAFLVKERAITDELRVKMLGWRYGGGFSAKRNFPVMTGAQCLELLCKHIPDRHEHLVRYAGWYSNRARGERAKVLEAQQPATAAPAA